MGPGDSSELPIRIGVGATPEDKTSAPSIQSGTEQVDSRRNPRASPERGGNEGGGPGGLLLHPILSPPKKDGGQRPVINLKALNGFVQTHHFKMKGIHTMKELAGREIGLQKLT